jgi:hypothetical protein
VCGEEFGSEGLARDLLEAFALHVRRRHSELVLTPGSLRQNGQRVVSARA